jgi:hypothetical protein
VQRLTFAVPAIPAMLGAAAAYMNLPMAAAAPAAAAFVFVGLRRWVQTSPRQDPWPRVDQGVSRVRAAPDVARLVAVPEA